MKFIISENMSTSITVVLGTSPFQVKIKIVNPEMAEIDVGNGPIRVTVDRLREAATQPDAVLAAFYAPLYATAQGLVAKLEEESRELRLVAVNRILAAAGVPTHGTSVLAKVGYSFLCDIARYHDRGDVVLRDQACRELSNWMDINFDDAVRVGRALNAV